MKKYLLMGLVAICLCIVASACNSRNDMNYSTRTKFPWVPNISAPRNYPVEIKYAYLCYGTEGDRYPVLSSGSCDGIGVSKGAVSFEDYEKEGGLDVPNGIEIVWLSFAESKIYKLHTTFSQNLQDEMLRLFREGFYVTKFDKHKTYSTLLMTMLPGGKVWLYMDGMGRTVLVCDTLQAEPIEMTLEEFDKDASYVSNSVQEYSEASLDKEQKAGIKANGIPFEIWEKYRERFNYDFKFEFEDKNSKMDSLSLAYNFINGEFYYASDGAKTGLLSRPKEIYLEWNVGDIKYKGQFFFNEKEVLEGFSKMFSCTKRGQKGTLIVKTSKYNNKFDIYLEIEGNKYFFKKTKIHVFRITPENKNDDDHLYYWNYEGEDVELYLGE
ncbi:conserved hypothetical protein with DUF2931 domain [Prevotella intermedia]|uniref:ATP-dependent DNA helicase RuvA n=1 Tax=Prevotella intermedia TaxID=28131 RepID=A0A0T7ANH7_PREIN|nr:DUF2931 family protein [Prevotella intermedia]BAU18561.1 conserved hypothetical protein with DUF2931 domain [Prevotella intermedia]